MALGSGSFTLWMSGASPGRASGSLSLWLEGAQKSSFATLPLYLANSGAEASLPLYLSGLGRTPGALPASGALDLYLHRWPAAELPLFLMGPGNPASGSVPLYTKGADRASGSLPLWLSGQGFSSSSMPLFARGF